MIEVLCVSRSSNVTRCGKTITQRGVLSRLAELDTCTPVTKTNRKSFKITMLVGTKNLAYKKSGYIHIRKGLGAPGKISKKVVSKV